MKSTEHKIKQRERSERNTHNNYIGSPFLRGYIQSFLQP